MSAIIQVVRDANGRACDGHCSYVKTVEPVVTFTADPAEALPSETIAAAGRIWAKHLPTLDVEILSLIGIARRKARMAVRLQAELPL